MIYLCEWLVRDKVQTNGWFSTTVLPETMISDARNREKERKREGCRERDRQVSKIS